MSDCADDFDAEVCREFALVSLFGHHAGHLVDGVGRVERILAVDVASVARRTRIAADVSFTLYKTWQSYNFEFFPSTGCTVSYIHLVTIDVKTTKSRRVEQEPSRFLVPPKSMFSFLVVICRPTSRTLLF